MSPKMARKVDKTVKLCVICGDKAKGINFNALTCMSCKAFFRRNALRNKEMKCPFNDSCQVDKITRKFCSKCRLKKCFDCGMKKEWILSDEEKRLIKEKIMRNRIRRQQQEMDQQAQRSGGSSTSGALVKIDPASVTTQGRRRHTVKDKQAARSSLSMDNQLAPYHASSNSSTFGSSTYCNSPSPNPFNGYGSKQITGSSSYNFFTEPSSYSLDILLTQDDCEPLMDSNYGANNAFGPSSNSQDDLFYSSPEPPKTSVLIDPKKDEFLSNSPPLDLDQEPMRRLSSTCAPSISASLNDCCSLLFANMDSIDLFDSDFLSMDFATSCNPGSDFSTSGQSSSYYGQGHQGSSCMESHVVEIKNSSSSSYNSSSSANGNNNYLKNEDFAQYLMQDNDPFTFNSQDQHLHQPSLFGDGRINATMDKPNTSNQTNRNWNQGFQDQMSPSKNNTVAVYNQQQSSNDYLTNYLLNENEMDHEISNFDPVIELIPRITSEGSFFRDIGFSNRELIQPERCLIKELRDACSILQNPYKRILYINLKTREDDSPHKCRITEFFIHRLIRMSRRLSSFAGLRLPDQVQLLKRGLIEMLCLRSVLLYDPDREAWCFQDDKCKLSIMVNLDVIKSSCLRADFQRHKNYPRLFLNEWKTDGVIFDLLTAIVLFTPRKDCADFDKIKEEKMRYTHLLRRYLEIKYPTIAEAKSTFSRLMACLEEVRLLNEDITRFFISLGKLHSSPLFAQLLDLPITQSNSPPPPPPPPASTVFYNPEPTNEPNMAGSPSSRNSSPNIYLNLEPMQQQASPASSTSSNAQAYVNQSNFVPYNACSTGTSGGASLMAQQCQQQHC